MESAHHSLSRPDCNSTADVPSFTLRTALSAIPFVFDLCGVDVQWFQDLPNSKKLSAWMIFGFLRTSLGSYWFPEKILFCTGRLLSLVPPTAHRRLFRDSLSSLRILWSAVIKSPKCSALGTTVPARFLQEAHCVLTRTPFHFCTRLHWQFMK